METQIETVIMNSDETSKKENSAIVYAGFWIRFSAHLIDEILVNALGLALTYFALYLVYLIIRPEQSFGEAFSGMFIQIASAGFELCIAVPYYVWFHFKTGQTIGKKLLGIQVVNEATQGSLTLAQSYGRFFSSLLSLILMGAGYIMVVMNPEKKALHDALSKTVSIRVK